MPGGVGGVRSAMIGPYPDSCELAHCFGIRGERCLHGLANGLTLLDTGARDGDLAAHRQ